MIEIKATTHKGTTAVEVGVEADAIAYMAEVVSSIESLMGKLKEDDKRMHACVLKVIADHPKILLGNDVEAELAEMMSRAIIRKGGVN